MVRFRESEDAFTCRLAIKKVTRLDGKAFEQAAGFLQIKGAKNPLDDSSVHPEWYTLATKIAKERQISIPEMIGNSKL